MTCPQKDSEIDLRIYVPSQQYSFIHQVLYLDAYIVEYCSSFCSESEEVSHVQTKPESKPARAKSFFTLSSGKD